MRDAWLLVCLVILRILWSISIATYFQADEFYQSLEPAHSMVYGYGFVPWEYKNVIRSIAHPLIYAVPYKFLEASGLDSVTAVTLVPKLIGGIQAAFGEFYSIKFIQKRWPNTGRLAILIVLLSPWNNFFATRSFSNALEAALTAYALYKWPFHWSKILSDDESYSEYLDTTIKSLSAIGFAAIIRPTTVLLWILPAFQQIKRYRTTFIFEAAFVAYVVLQYSVILDSFYYGSICLPVLNFLKFNVTGSASFYGVNDWHYYVTQALPLLTVAYLPFFMESLVRNMKRDTEALSMAMIMILALSLIGHKEVRFLSPVLPIINGCVADSVARFNTRAHNRRSRLWKRLILGLMFGVNIVTIWYSTQVHQRGVMDLMSYVAKHQEIQDLILLMPCHSTPWQSTLHRRANFRFLTCEPPLGLSPSEVSIYRDEADQFYDNPVLFLKELHDSAPFYGYVATFSSSKEELEYFWRTERQPYHLERRWFNSHFHDDSRRRGDVLLYRLYDDDSDLCGRPVVLGNNEYQHFA